MRVLRATTTGSAITLIAFAAAHVFEDFAYGIPEGRFGLDPTVAAVGSGIAFAAEAGAMVLAARGRWSGQVLNVMVGIGWVLAVALDHLGEIVFASDYRAGVLSKGLEVGAMVAGVVLAATSTAAIVKMRRQR
jgi:hypothetical protein